MMENEKELPAGQAESSEGCAGARIEGERNCNPSNIVYNPETVLSTIKDKIFTKITAKGITERFCVICGKRYAYFHPQYKYKDCCSPTCWLHRNDGRKRSAVEMYEKSGRYLKTFKTVEEAAEFCGFNDTRPILDALRGRTRSSGGFVWLWSNDPRD